MKTKKKWLVLPLALLGVAALAAVYVFAPRLIPGTGSASPGPCLRTRPPFE